MIRTRFAPSPTGYLHVGNLRTALYAYIIAKQNNGQFLLRIEDTDRERYVADGVEHILKALYWVGIEPDEGVKLDEYSTPGEVQVIEEGAKGPYTQSKRLEIYQKYAAELIDKGAAYHCFCSNERLDKLREEQQKNKLPSGYDRFCLTHVPLEEASERIKKGERHVVRLKMPKDGETVFNDTIRGEVRFKNNLVDDQVLIKSDGFPTYHMAVVVDDHLMEITHVIRGEEWISSTPKHLQLYTYFGWQPPQFAHLPLFLNADRSKLSKRQGDVSVHDYRTKGYLPEAILNFMAFLGWNPGDEREIFSLTDLVKEFSLAKVSKAGGVFNLEKLDWYNREYLKRISDDELVKRALPFLIEAGLIKSETSIAEFQKPWLAQVLALEKERVTTLAEFPEALKFVFELPAYLPELLVWKKSSREEALSVLEALENLLHQVPESKWDREGLEKMVVEWIVQKDYQKGAVLSPLRVALSGQQNSPGPFEIAAVLGKTESLHRIKHALALLS